MSEETPMIYNDDILQLVDLYSLSASQTSAILGINSDAAIGAILEEYNDRFESGSDIFWQALGDNASFFLNSNHADLLQEFNEINQLSPQQRNELNKLSNPILLDVGVGNVQIYTAIGLLNDYNEAYPNSDPLGLKQYNTDYSKLALDLDTTFNNATVKFSSLMIEKGFNWGASNVANWDTLSSEEQQAFSVYFYNVGEDFLNSLRDNAINENGEYNIDIANTDIAQEYLLNLDAIRAHSDPNLVNLSGLRELIASGALNEQRCFLAGTQITMFDGTTKNIEDITPDDIVMSYDETGKLVPGRVTKTFQNQVKHILNVHGLMVTLGHVTLCGDGAFKGQHVPMIDIIRSDGAVVKTDGSLVRVNTNCAVGSYEDQFVLLAIGEMGKDGLHVRDQGRVRIGARFILPDGRDMSIAEILAASGATVNDEGLVDSKTMPEPTPLHLSFLEAMPQVEDYILARSGLSLDEIYDAGEWEATRPQMPAPVRVKQHPKSEGILMAEANYKSPPKLH